MKIIIVESLIRSTKQYFLEYKKRRYLLSKDQAIYYIQECGCSWTIEL